MSLHRETGVDDYPDVADTVRWMILVVILPSVLGLALEQIVISHLVHQFIIYYLWYHWGMQEVIKVQYSYFIGNDLNRTPSTNAIRHYIFKTLSLGVKF